MEKVYTRTKGIQPDMVDGFCPGCMHSTLFKLIGEVLEEMDMLDKCTCAIGVGCCGLGMGYFTYDYLLAAHGRACAVATGAKRSNPDTLVFTYQGDGDLASIGLAETMSAANRGENISVIFVNNGIYGMTGGQLAPTTLVGMKATTAPKGRDPREHGYPMHVCEILNQLTAPYYLERTSCNNPANVARTKAAIRKAFQNQLDGKGLLAGGDRHQLSHQLGTGAAGGTGLPGGKKCSRSSPWGSSGTRIRRARDGTKSDGRRVRRTGRDDAGQVSGGGHLREHRQNVTFFPPTARSSGAAPPTAMWSSPTTISARRWAIRWTT